ncbi:MAG: tRNA (adenosine(37)-N6)-threonylcarbamoyltransferase complex dimerization subunit type 1 TsaB [Oligoflexia bacterium]|nr:tRNA (adenosine(37)-N6)-threonylcarbamoyltransferase complex dimerization subunit type 1 TsaB [Oligoflexia bacterium]
MTAGGAVLGIDTAAPVVGAALWLPDGTAATWQQRVVRGADAVLLPAVAAMLESLTVPLVRVAVVVGPGAFTGLRVGVATALGLAVSRDLPVVPVGALAARAALVDGPRVLALLDARKGRVYAGLFSVQDGWPRALGPQLDAPLCDVLPEQPFVAVGEGAAAFSQVIKQAGGEIVEQPQRSAALAVARCGVRLPALDPAELALRYLRSADAVPPRDLGQRVGWPRSG